MHKDQLSQAQHRLWLLDQLQPDKPLLNLALAHRIRGPLDFEALSWAVLEIGHLHDCLRSEVLVHDDQPYQLIKSLELKLAAEDYSPLLPAERQRLVALRLQEEIESPFDHSRAPLIRFFLLREAPEQHVLLIVASQVILDQESLDQVWRELGLVYAARRQDRDLPSSRRARFLAEGAQRQPAAVREQKSPASLDYWHGELQGMPLALDLGADQGRPRLPSFRAARSVLELDPEHDSLLRELCRETGLPPRSVALAALEVVLSRYSGQEDFGIAVSTRSAAAAAELGVLARFLPIRSDIKSGLSFAELVQCVHARHERGRQHDELRAPELQVSFSCHGTLSKDFAIEGLSLERLPLFGGYSTSELGFCLRLDAEGTELAVDSASDMYRPEAGARLCRSWRSVLAAAVHNPELSLDELPVVAADDARHLLVTLNETRSDWDQRALVHRLFEAQVDRQPEAVALVFEEQSLSFAELDARANRLAQLLTARGVGPDSLVGLCLRRTPEMVVAMLAILKAGGAYVPLDPDYPPDRIEYVLGDSQAKVLISSSDLAARLKAAPACVLIDEDAPSIAQAPSERLQREEHSAQLCYVIYTSGSTGKPKGVMVEHRNATSFFRGMQRAIGLDGHGVWLAATSISFDISVLEILGSLCHGRRIVLLGEAVLGQVADPRYSIPAQIARHGITHFQCTPSQARILLLDEAGRAALASLEQFLVGGEALAQELADELTLLVQGSVVNMYGPTETTVWSTTAVVEHGERVGIGRPIANTCLFVLDARGRLVPPGAVGELYIGGPGVTRGYHARPELTSERFVDNKLRPELGARLYRTGDLVRYAADGSLLYLGRNDHQVKIRGHRIELGEIESAIRKAAGVRDVTVVARGNPADQRLVAYVVTARAFAGDEALRKQLRDSLPDFMQPAAIVHLDALPMTPNGKIDRNALPEVGAADLGPSEYVPPRGDRERKLSEIWEQALGVPRVGRTDSFFDLGGHSLLAVKISNDVEKSFGVRLPLATLFEHPTLETFAERLGKLCDGDGSVAPPWTTLVPIQPKGSLPPLFCVAGVGGNPMNLFHLAVALGNDQPFWGLQLRGVDGQQLPHRSVEAMAEEMLGDIRTLQPHGPYYLAGYSFGGLAALEMAQRLRDVGESVGLVVLFDTMNPELPAWTWRQRFQGHLANLRERGPGYFANRVWARARAELIRRRRTFYAQIARFNHFEYRNEAVWVASEKAMACYQPRVYQGDVLLLQADWRLNDFGGGIGVRPHESNGWGELLPALQIIEVPTSHEDVVSELASPLAAAALAQALSHARERAGHGRAPPASTPPPAPDANTHHLVRVA